MYFVWHVSTWLLNHDWRKHNSRRKKDKRIHTGIQKFRLSCLLGSGPWYLLAHRHNTVYKSFRVIFRPPNKRYHHSQYNPCKHLHITHVYNKIFILHIVLCPADCTSQIESVYMYVRPPSNYFFSLPLPKLKSHDMTSYIRNLSSPLLSILHVY